MSDPYYTRNPSSGEKLKPYQVLNQDEVCVCAERSLRAFSKWKQTSFQDRAKILTRAAELLQEQKESLAKVMALEMGKPFSSGIAEIEKCAWVCEYYAEKAESFLANEEITTDAERSYLAYRPLGPVFAVMPWNFPFWQVFRFAAPALMAGNTALLKHASLTTQCALEIEKLFHRADLPQHVFQTLLMDHEGSEALIRHPAVQAVTLTGSTEAGRKIAEIAGSELKKVVLELGGSDPYVVLKDADPQKAAEICVKGRMINNGESCIAAKRFITVPEIHDEFVDAVLTRMKSYKMGDPLSPETNLGPMASKKMRDQLHDQVLRTLQQGAESLLGAEIPDGQGFYYPPTVLVGVTSEMAAGHEELFGPVACIFAAKDEEDALRIANDTEFGLGACVITEDTDRGLRIAETRLEAGCCFVNAHVKSDPRLPFGGIKGSGFGRELSSLGIREFVNCKTVYLA